MRQTHSIHTVQHGSKAYGSTKTKCNYAHGLLNNESMTTIA